MKRLKQIIKRVIYVIYVIILTVSFIYAMLWLMYRYVLYMACY